ncbi:MAG: MATE family efflux transporter [Treponemataceae bacterium]
MNKLQFKIKTASILSFTFPTIIMNVFMAVYTMVDGIFIARFVGTDALSAINIIFPFFCLITSIGVMFGTGGSAVVAKIMGEGNEKLARKIFSLLALSVFAISLFFISVGLIFRKEILTLLGSTDLLYNYSHTYLVGILFFTPFFMLQMIFQNFFVTASKSTIGLIVIVIGGLSNILFDYIFIVILELGILGAALATGIGVAIPAMFALFYFSLNRKNTLYFVWPSRDLKVLLQSCSNGSSEMVSNLAMAVTTYLFNMIMLKYAGENGVAAITIILYSGYLLSAIFMGYAMGIAPVVSFNYGEKNHTGLSRLLKRSLFITGAISIVTLIVANIFAPFIAHFFAKDNESVKQLAIRGLHLYSISFIFLGFNIFASSFFTALSNGRVSATISFLRTLVFLTVGLLILPAILKINGVWLAVPIAEVLTVIVSVFYFVKLKKVYNY